jgi:hypothetical protein
MTIIVGRHRRHSHFRSPGSSNPPSKFEIQYIFPFYTTARRRRCPRRAFQGRHGAFASPSVCRTWWPSPSGLLDLVTCSFVLHIFGDFRLHKSTVQVAGRIWSLRQGTTANRGAALLRAVHWPLGPSLATSRVAGRSRRHRGTPQSSPLPA